MHVMLTYYSVFVPYMLCTHSSFGVLVNNTLDEARFSTMETSSIASAVNSISNTTISLNSSSVQMNEETSTNKYDTMKKMNLIKNAPKPAPTTNSESGVSTYRLKDEDDSTCILMTVDALVSFFYLTTSKEKEESAIFVPDQKKIELSGDCSSGEKSSMLLKWKSFSLNFDFVKTPGGERWFVSSIQLSFNTKDLQMEFPNHPKTYVQAATIGDPLFPTPVGRSFKCHRELEVALIDPQYSDINITLLLRELTLEPFIFKNDDFGPEYLCFAAGAGSFRSETAPFIFGSLLTLASLCTISIYAIYRYLKMNKVQYDAME